jgi:type II secretory pathway component GspD/PulD (secretin)
MSTNWFRILVVAVLVGSAIAMAQTTVLEVIDLKYRNAQEVLPVLQPFVARTGSISALNNQLIVRTTPQNLAELRKILDGIDRRPRRLMITVSQDLALADRDLGAAVTGTVGGENASITLPGSSGEAKARIYSSQSAGAERGGQTVQVLEGNAAFIRVGESAPITTRQIIQTPLGSRAVDTTQLREANSGFYARPRTRGDRVTVEISVGRDQFTNSGTGATDIRRVATVVSGRLGEWIDLGGSTRSGVGDESGIAYRSSEAAMDRRRLYLKVEEVQ